MMAKDHIDDGGPAFPRPASAPGAYDGQTGMTLRDWLAARCPQQWIDEVRPKTVGEVRQALINRGIIPADRAAKQDAIRSYTAAEADRLLIALRWDYADAMLAERNK